jgi:5-methylcytosine-specific restriction protein A
MGVGRFASSIYLADHWDGSGRAAPFADLDFERVLAPADVLPVRALVARASGTTWNSLRGGGVAVSAKTEDKVDHLWADHLTLLDGVPAVRRNPPWAWDEIVLALDLYFRIGVQSATHPDVVELSETLNLLPIHSDRPQADRFRNPNGVNLKLANLAHIDPTYPGTGMARGSKRDREVFNAYIGDLDGLSVVADAIRSLARAGTVPIFPEPDEEEVAAPEGRVLYRRHRTRERDLKVVARKKAEVLRTTSRLACQACDLDFSERYGRRGKGFIECHHTKPLAESGPTVTRLGDLILLCSNCHRMVHLRSPMLSLAELRALCKVSASAVSTPPKRP